MDSFWKVLIVISLENVTMHLTPHMQCFAYLLSYAYVTMQCLSCHACTCLCKSREMHLTSFVSPTFAHVQIM